MINMQETAGTHQANPDPGALDGEAQGNFSEPTDLRLAMWRGLEGATVMLCGVLLPAVVLTIFGVTCAERVFLLMLKHPLETFIECGLAISIPISNLITWTALCHGDKRHVIRRGIANGVAIGSSAALILISAAALFLSPVVLDSMLRFALGAVLGFACLALAVAVHLAVKSRASWEIRSARTRSTVYAVCGVILSFLALVGAEARSVAIRVAENMAVSEASDERKSAMSVLRSLSAEKDLRMECADNRTAGMAGMFIQFDPAVQKQIYFAVTGKPYRDLTNQDYASFSDDYLRRHVVGPQVSGLSLVRSAMTGMVHPETLSSSLKWTFVFKNRNYIDQEVRSEIALPKGAVISGVTIWADGQPIEASFAPTGKAQTSGQWVVAGHTSPAMVTDLGRGRILLHCYPVPGQGELKMMVTIASPLKLETETQATLALPRLVDSNFSVAGAHTMRLRSGEALALGLPGMRSGASGGGEHFLAGTLKEDDLTGNGMAVKVDRKPGLAPIAVASPDDKSVYIVETVSKVRAAAPQNLYIVLDGSQVVKDEIPQLKKALAKIPSSVNAYLLVASEEKRDNVEPVRLSEGLKTLDQFDFVGGQNNLQAVVAAAERAGETTGGAVLWIHGPQPSFNKEIYIVNPYAATPAFYELGLDNGLTDSLEFFKNHSEIGPFTAVARNASVEEDLSSFFSRWQPGGFEYRVTYKETGFKSGAATASDDHGYELACLMANERCADLLSRGRIQDAARVAVDYKLVTAVSAATVLDGYSRDSQPEAAGFNRTEGLSTPIGPQPSNHYQAFQASGGDAYSTGATGSEAALPLQGAVNGTIGPQSGDATVISGINTAGAVRVNNLANLEAMLKMLTTTLQIAMIIFGAGLGISGMVNSAARVSVLAIPVNIRPGLRIAIGLGIIALAIAVPGVVDGFLASARDACLFE